MAPTSMRAAWRALWITLVVVCVLPSFAFAQRGAVYAGAMADGVTVLLDVRLEPGGGARLLVTTEAMSGVSGWRPEFDAEAAAQWTEQAVKLQATGPLGVRVWATRTRAERSLDPFGFAVLTIPRSAPEPAVEIRLVAIGTHFDLRADLADGSLDVLRRTPFFYDSHWSGIPLVDTMLQDIGASLAEGLAQRRELPTGATARWYDAVGDRIVGFGPTVVSVVRTRSSYTGGAHPNQWTSASTWVKLGESWAEVDLCGGLAALQLPCPEERLREAVLDRLDEAGALWVVEGEVTSTTPWLLDTFSLTPRAIRFDFSPYEVGPYAQGPFTVRISYQEVSAP